MQKLDKGTSFYKIIHCKNTWGIGGIGTSIALYSLLKPYQSLATSPPPKEISDPNSEGLECFTKHKFKKQINPVLHKLFRRILKFYSSDKTELKKKLICVLGLMKYVLGIFLWLNVSLNKYFHFFWLCLSKNILSATAPGWLSLLAPYSSL